MEVIGLKWTNVDRIGPKWTKQNQSGYNGPNKTEYTEYDQIGLNKTEVDKMNHIGPKQNQSGHNRPIGPNGPKWIE